MGKKPRRKLSSPNRAVAYVRVSTNAEKQELSIEAQKAAIERYAKSQEIEVLEWFYEEVSGGAPLDRRPVLLDAISAVSSLHCGVLLVAKLDRFSRDTTTAAVVGLELARAGAKLQTADGHGNGEDPSAKLLRGILLEVAQYERAIIQARIRAALNIKRERGEALDKAPFGWRANSEGMLEEDPKEQETLRLVQLFSDQGFSVRTIVARLRELGVTGRTGKALELTQVQKLVVRLREKAA